jgi:hypothetical protein
MVESFGNFDEGAQVLDFNDNGTGNGSASDFMMPSSNSFDGAATGADAWPTSQFSSSQLATPLAIKDDDDFTPEELAQIEAV